MGLHSSARLRLTLHMWSYYSAVHIAGCKVTDTSWQCATWRIPWGHQRLWTSDQVPCSGQPCQSKPVRRGQRLGYVRLRQPHAGTGTAKLRKTMVGCDSTPPGGAMEAPKDPDTRPGPPPSANVPFGIGMYCISAFQHHFEGAERRHPLSNL